MAAVTVFTVAACAGSGLPSGVLDSDQRVSLAAHADGITKGLLAAGLQPVYYSNFEKGSAVTFVPPTVHDVPCGLETVELCRNQGDFDHPSVERTLQTVVTKQEPNKFDFTGYLRAYGQRLTDKSIEFMNCRRNALPSDGDKLPASIAALPGLVTLIPLPKGQHEGFNSSLKAGALVWDCARDTKPLPSPSPS